MVLPLPIDFEVAPSSALQAKPNLFSDAKTCRVGGNNVRLNSMKSKANRLRGESKIEECEDALGGHATPNLVGDHAPAGVSVLKRPPKDLAQSEEAGYNTIVQNGDETNVCSGFSSALRSCNLFVKGRLQLQRTIRFSAWKPGSKVFAAELVNTNELSPMLRSQREKPQALGVDAMPHDVPGSVLYAFGLTLKVRGACEPA